MENDREVSTEDGKQLAAKLGTLFIEASAKMNTNVKELFFDLVRQVKQWRQAHPDQAPTPMPNQQPQKKKQKCTII